LIHNTYLVRISTYEILASTQYWPVEVEKDALAEFITTREELRQEDASLSDFPLIVGDDKFHGRDLAKDVMLVFVTDKGEDESAIGDRLDSAIKALRRQLLKKEMSEVLQHYESIIDPSVVTRLKIALVGEGGVGKTTTLHLLMGDTPPLQYVPTIALNLETVENIRFGNYSLVLWDFAGQERFRNLWKFYFHGADVIFLVCDSSLRNVIISKDIYKLIKRDAPKVPVFSLANKQDKPNAMRPEVVQKILGIPTYPMVAIDKSRRDEMLRILMTAAAQFVGVVLPDLPASELLKFTDEATADAISEEVLSAPSEDEEDGEVEEVFVDEDGHIISPDELGDEYEYEVIEEEVAEEELEVTEPDVQPSLSEPEKAEEIEIAETPLESVNEPVEEVVEEEIEIPIITEEESPTELLVETEIVEEDVSESIEEMGIPETPLEKKPEVLETSREASIYMESWEQSVDSSEDDELRPVSVGPETEEGGLTPSSTPLSEELDLVNESDDDSRKIAREIISEALDADEIISAEIDKVSHDELDVALEAFSSEETMPAKDEDQSTEDIAEEALKELDDILGSPDEPPISTPDDEEGDIEADLDALDELFALMSDDE
jgi:small GTP-binding protein